MKRFIWLSFGFLALAFYELSGGAEFDPVAARNAAVLARVDTEEAPQNTDLENARKPSVLQTANAPDITPVSLKLASFEDAFDQRPGRSTKPILTKTLEATQQSAPAVKPPSTIVTPIEATISAFDTTPDADGVLPSIVFQGSRAQASSDAVSPRRGIRSISADVVNMRSGPGTGFDVVTKLNRDTEVEVLEDDGTGWVKLRPVAGGPEGWIADFLLSNG
ncbi:SH3 domain-containing protein [Roseobacter sp.]|uniref:SH3 domain-containing protein n=1 Tax=Roseobacter sp. TaxID=1907202 RepID=UPI00385EB01B